MQWVDQDILLDWNDGRWNREGDRRSALQPIIAQTARFQTAGRALPIRWKFTCLELPYQLGVEPRTDKDKVVSERLLPLDVNEVLEHRQG